MDAQTLHDLQVRAATGDAQAAHTLRAEYERRERSPLEALDLERRFNLPAAAGLALKADAERVVTGYASTFESEARADSYGDIVAPGAFAEAIARHTANERRIRYLYQHAWEMVLGRPEVIKEDDRGLWTESYHSQTQLGSEALTLAQDAALDSFSIGFYVRGYEFFDRPDGTWIRRLTKIDLWEYSLVTFPANLYARVADVRAARANNATPAIPNARLARLLDDCLTKTYAGICLANLTLKERP